MTESSHPQRTFTVSNEISKRFRIVKLLAARKVFASFLVVDTSEIGNRENYHVLKMLHKDYIEDEERLRNFKTEGETVCNLRHPGIVKGVEYGEIGGAPYLLTKYQKGVQMDSIFRKKERKIAAYPFFIAHISNLLVDVLVYLHHEFHPDMSIAHGDFGIHNMLLTPDHKPIVLDFEKCHLSSKENINMSPNYPLNLPYTNGGFSMLACPEASECKDHFVDTYSLGSTIFTLLTQHSLRYFSGEGEGLPVDINVHFPDDFDQLPRNEKVKIRMLKIAAKASAYRREDRYQSALQMKRDIVNVVEKFSDDIDSALRGKAPGG